MRGKLLITLGMTTAMLLCLPAAASATWMHKGEGELTEDAEVTLSGEVTLTTSVGNVVCPTGIDATLSKESSAGTVDSYTVAEPSACTLTGSLGAICGEHGLTGVEKTGSWGFTAETTDIKLSSIDLHFKFAGCFIPAFRLKGTATASVDKKYAIGTVTLSGSQTIYNTLEEEVGSGALGGSLSVSPSGTYGIEKTPTEPTKWLHENEALGADAEPTLAGAFSFTYAGGGVSCTVSAELKLLAGEVETETPEGEVKSFTVAEPTKCTLTGTLKELCGAGSVSSVEKTGSWGLTTNKSDISVSGLVLDYKFKECAVSSLRVEGDATVSVDKASAIAETTFSGSPSVYNSAEEKIGTATLSGSQSVSPAGTFAIAEIPPPPPCETGGGESAGWTHEGSYIAEACTEKFTGYMSILNFGGTGYIACEAHMSLEMAPGGGSIGELDVTENACEGTGLLAGCELEEAEQTGEASLTPTAASFDIQEIVLELLFEEGCPLSEVTTTAESLEATVDNSEGIGAFELAGEAVMHLLGQEIETETFGEFEAAKPGTFGLG